MKKKVSSGSSNRSGRRRGQKNGAVSRPAPDKQQQKKQGCQPADKTEGDSPPKKKMKGNKKRVKRHKQFTTGDADVEDPSLSGTMDGPKEGVHKPPGISAVQLTEGLDDAMVDHPSISTTEYDPHQRRRALQLARAEERRREMERKRLEKQELEQQRQEEEAKKLELLKKLAQEAEELSVNKEKEDNTKTITQENLDLQGRLAELEALRQAEKTTLLEHKGKQLERMLSTAELEAQEALMRAKQISERVKAEEERKRKEENKKEQEKERRLKEEEEQLIQKKKEEEHRRRAAEKARLQAEEETDHKLKGKEEMNYKMRLELQTQKHYQQLTSHVFSYFRYVPPATSAKNKSKKPVRTKRK